MTFLAKPIQQEQKQTLGKGDKGDKTGILSSGSAVHTILSLIHTI